MKKILYLDMDGVVADFDSYIKKLCPDLETGDSFPNFESREILVEDTCRANPTIFENLDPIEGSVEAVNELFDLFDLYFLSTPMWNLPQSFTGKRVWLEKYFADKAKQRLILTHRKDLVKGDFLVDDRLRHGVDKFEGLHIHFATPKFPDWKTTLTFLKTQL